MSNSVRSATIGIILVLLAVPVFIAFRRISNVTVFAHRSWIDGSGSYVCTYSATPHQLDETDISLDVSDKSGKAVAGCNVTAEPEMPSMTMPATVVHMREEQPGSYSGQIRYTMAGEWVVHVKMARSGKVISDELFNVIVR